MLAPIVTKDPIIELIENSGIQFLDYEFTLNPYDSSVFGPIEKGYFLIEGDGDARRLTEIELEENGEEGISSTGKAVRDLEAHYVRQISSLESLRIYNGVWFPLPYFAKSSLAEDGRLRADESEAGPLNWARARVVRVGQKASDHRYRVVLAFDTAVQPDDGRRYFAPRLRDITNGSEFSFDSRDGGSHLLRPDDSGSSWVEEWADAVFETFAKNSKMSRDDLVDCRRELYPQAHYLNMIRLLGMLIHPTDIRIIARSRDPNRPCAEVSLVLDIGNSRSCGTLVEHNRQHHDSPSYSKLCLRDLNAPELIYNDAFESSLEFSKPNFEFDGRSGRSGRSDAFAWPSIARTGHEAVRLSAMRVGNEGETGVSSPKRRLWDEDRSQGSKEWCFNQYSYQMPILDENGRQVGYSQASRGGKSRPAYLWPLSDHINSKGDALFACEDPRNVMAEYSGKSTMTFMLIEIIAQALCQINSYAYRSGTDDKNLPRNLNAVVLTYPPSMPDLERETFRGCAYEALGILWKCYGYDTSAPEEMGFLDDQKCWPPLPKLVLEWDEAEAAQIVYLYNESQQIFNGNNVSYLKFLRRPDADGRFGEHTHNHEGRKLISARVASVDIGGGTTDLVVTDYASIAEVDEHKTPVCAREVLREGFKTAGDDLLLEIMQKCVMAPLGASIDAYTAEHHLQSASDTVLSSIFTFNKDNPGAESDQASFRRMRQQTVKQIFMKIGYRILAHLELMDGLPEGTKKAVIRGSVLDFIKGGETSDHPELTLPPETSAIEPEERLFKFINDFVRVVIPNFDFKAFEIKVDLVKLNRSFESGGNCIARSLNTLSALISIYKPDVLLLTGRPSRILGIRDYFLGRTALPASRIVRMADYSCGSWYPYTTGGSAIGDTKTTVAVGAAIAHLRTEYQTFRNFTFELSMPAQASPVRYFGHVDDADFVKKSCYRFVTEAEFKRVVAGEDYVGDDLDEGRMRQLADSVGQTDEELMAMRELHVEILPDNLAYRQFSSPDYPATRLYSLEIVQRLEDIEDLCQAAALSFYREEDIDTVLSSKVLQPDDLDKINSYRMEYEKAKAELLARSTPDEAELHLHYENVAREQALAQAREELKSEAPTGILGRLKQGAYDAKVQARAAELCAQAFSKLDSQVQAALENSKSLARDALASIQEGYFTKVREVLNARYEAIYQTTKEDLKRLDLKVQHSGAFDIRVKLDERNSYPCPRLKALWDKLGKNPEARLPKIFKLKLDEAKFAGRDYKRYVRLRLKTVNDSDYWTDSGQIYAGFHAGSMDFAAD